MKPACGPDFLGPLLGHATHLARERMDARLSRYDMTPSQTHTLLYLSSHGYTAPQRDVVEHDRFRAPFQGPVVRHDLPRGPGPCGRGPAAAPRVRRVSALSAGLNRRIPIGPEAGRRSRFRADVFIVKNLSPNCY